MSTAIITPVCTYENGAIKRVVLFDQYYAPSMVPPLEVGDDLSTPVNT